ncbi:ABC transporter permease [Gephyromycinifex aptenodytis]|uniref:ABC transporter permease n=1 Tax=Gephyromycinifex aptenodytis TaxID=2716227 RepID=UPI001447DFCF|nr:ABC transporter permease [Gephyromycinifex aptenodytis]
MIGILASIVEAYGELRVNKGRVLLSLIGVAVSVFAMTTVLGAGEMLRNSMQQSFERISGREATLVIQGMGASSSGASDAHVLEALDRLGVEHRSRSMDTQLGVQTGRGVFQADVKAVDPAYGDMFRIRVDQGRWLDKNDQVRLSPVAVVNERLYDKIGRPPLGTAHLSAYGPNREAAVQFSVIGVLPAEPGEERLLAYLPVEALAQFPASVTENVISRSYYAWVPPESVEPVQARLATLLRDVPGGPFDTFTNSTNLDEMGFRQMEYGLVGVAAALLLLGALGLVNISLVTVRYRMREIGIRRSYGATGLRIFVGVLMESVVATVLAGAIGVTAAIALVRSPFVTGLFRDIGLIDLPPFPISAVLIGLAAATIVGALAGIIPALIATRIKVIDAIRA